jgi:hypothetical protein
LTDERRPEATAAAAASSAAQEEERVVAADVRTGHHEKEDTAYCGGNRPAKKPPSAKPRTETTGKDGNQVRIMAHDGRLGVARLGEFLRGLRSERTRLGLGFGPPAQ